MASKKVGTFSVPGKPHGKERVQFNTAKKRAYTPQTQKDYEQKVWDSYYAAGHAHYEFDALVRVDIVCCYELPKDMSEAEKAALIGTPAYRGSPVEKRRQAWERKHLKKDEKRYGPLADGDNCLKSIQDGLNGVSYRDDCQVIEASVRSVYGRESCTQVRITVLGPKDTTGGDEE